MFNYERQVNERYLEDQNASFVNWELLETASMKKAGIMFSLLLSSPQKSHLPSDLPKPYT